MDGLGILKIDKTQLTVFLTSIWGVSVWGAKPAKAPRGDETAENDCLFVSKPFKNFRYLNPCLFDHENSKVY